MTRKLLQRELPGFKAPLVGGGDEHASRNNQFRFDLSARNFGLLAHDGWLLPPIRFRTRVANRNQSIPSTLNMDTLVAVATFGVLLLCWYLLKMAVKRAKMVHLVDKLPGPRAYPVFGNSWKVLTLPRNQLMAQAKKNVTEFGPLFRTWIGPLPEVHLIKPQHFELFLGSPKHIDKGLSYKFLHQWLGTGLLTSTGESIITLTVSGKPSVGADRVPDT
uniref:Cytochrome P450 n=1 Tax=Timema genevievae TaxID=629358 RepID=A0A7R9K3N1_TIMGE|nr:unnamed protein product [Timema genevievae]